MRSALAVTGEEGTSLSCVGLSDAAPAFCQSSSQTPSLSVRDFGESSGRLAVITVNGVPKRGTEGTVARGIMELVEKVRKGISRARNCQKSR